MYVFTFIYIYIFVYVYGDILIKICTYIYIL